MMVLRTKKIFLCSLSICFVQLIAIASCWCNSYIKNIKNSNNKNEMIIKLKSKNNQQYYHQQNHEQQVRSSSSCLLFSSKINIDNNDTTSTTSTTTATKSNDNNKSPTTTTTTTEENTETTNNIFYIRKGINKDIGIGSKILTDSFFKSKTNFIEYQFEKLETYLSLDSTFYITRFEKYHELYVACDIKSNKVIGIVEIDGRTNNSLAKSIRKKKKKNNNRNTISGVDDLLILPYMCNLAIDEKYRRLGIGTSLVNECECTVRKWNEESKGIVPNKIYLKVRQTSIDAVSMYDKLGYHSYLQEEDTFAKYGKEIIISMSKDL